MTLALRTHVRATRRNTLRTSRPAKTNPKGSRVDIQWVRKQGPLGSPTPPTFRPKLGDPPKLGDTQARRPPQPGDDSSPETAPARRRPKSGDHLDRVMPRRSNTVR